MTLAVFFLMIAAFSACQRKIAVSPSPIYLFTPTPTTTQTPSASPTNSPTRTPTSTASYTATYSPTPTPTSTGTASYTDTFSATATKTPSDTPTNTLTDSPTLTPTDTPTITLTPNKPPSVTVTPPVPFTPTVPPGSCGLLENSFETFTGTGPYNTENGSVAVPFAVTSVGLSQTNSGATVGTNALDAFINPGGSANLVDWSGFAPGNLTNVLQIVMDVTADPGLISGTYDQLYLAVQNTIIPVFWQQISASVDIAAGTQSVTFTVDWTSYGGTLNANSQITDIVLAWNTDGAGTGNLYMDNVRFIYNPCPPTPTPTPILANNNIWSFGAPCPVGVAVDNQGTFYVSNPCAGNIGVFDFNGDPLYTITLPNPNPWGNFPEPLGMTLDNNGNLFVADHGNGIGEILEFNAASGALENMFWGSNNNSVTFLNAPYDVKLDGSGNLIVADYGGGYVAKIDPATDTVIALCSNSGSIAPAGLVLDATGTNVYVTDLANAQVVQYDSATLTVQSSFNGSGWTQALVAPFGIGLDQAGNLVICDPGAGSVVNATTAGAFLQYVAPGQGNFGQCLFLAFDPPGNLYVAINNFGVVAMIKNGVGNFQ